MRPAIWKIGAWLAPEYYISRLLSGAIVATAAYFAVYGMHFADIVVVGFIAISTLLYPCSRYVYESFIIFVTGEDAIAMPTLLRLFAELITIVLCWVFAICMAPLGMVWLYWIHQGSERRLATGTVGFGRDD